MIDQLPEFYRIVNPSPTDTLITQRQHAIEEIQGELESPKTRIALADIAAFGFPESLNPDTAAAANMLIACIQNQQPSFMADIKANALDLRVCAGIALAQYMGSEEDEYTAALVVSSLGTQVCPEQRHLASFLFSLLSVARELIDDSGEAGRERDELVADEIAGADLPSALESANQALRKLSEAVEQNARADREELDILWWLFGGQSSTVGEPFESLKLGERALTVGFELAELVVIPPIAGCTQFLRATMSSDDPLTVKEIMESCTPTSLEVVAKGASDVGDVLSNHPALLPLTWLCRRRIDSGLAGGWQAEFQHKTHVQAKEERAASQWAMQAFNERVAIRIGLRDQG